MKNLSLLLGLCAVGLLLPSWTLGEGLDLYAPAFQSLKKEYLQITEEATKDREQSLNELIQTHLKEAQEMLGEKKKSGNISGMAIARAAIATYEEWATSFAKTKDFGVPDRVRRELKETIEDCRKTKQEIEDRYKEAAGPAEKDFYDRFVEIARAHGGADQAEDKLAEQFRLLMLTQDRVTSVRTPTRVARPPKAESPVATETTPTNGMAAPPAMPEVPEVVGTLGHAKRWIAFAHWTLETYGLEVIRIPVNQIEELQKTSGGGDMTGQPYLAVYRPFRVLKPGPGLAFQVKSLHGKLAVDLLEWPEANNGWSFLVRVRPFGELPSQHALELQVGEGADLRDPGTPGPAPTTAGMPTGAVVAAIAPPPAPAKVIVRSEPAGALVYVDNSLCMAGDKALKTPCEVEMNPGSHDVTLKLSGYLDGKVRGFVAKPGGAVEWTFRKDEPATESSLRVFASIGWLESKVQVRKGDRVVVTVVGSWSCGADGEKVDGQGYPRGGVYEKYYLGPVAGARCDTRLPYGALIFQIGSKGVMRVAGKGTKCIAETDGFLHFGINEANRRENLADNKGTLTVYVQNLGPGK